MGADHHSRDEAGRYALKCNPAYHREDHPAYTSINATTEDESRRGGNRQSGEGLVSDELADIASPRHAIDWGVHDATVAQDTRLTTWAAT